MSLNNIKKYIHQSFENAKSFETRNPTNMLGPKDQLLDLIPFRLKAHLHIMLLEYLPSHFYED